MTLVTDLGPLADGTAKEELGVITPENDVTQLTALLGLQSPLIAYEISKELPSADPL